VNRKRKITGEEMNFETHYSDNFPTAIRFGKKNVLAGVDVFYRPNNLRY